MNQLLKHSLLYISVFFLPIIPYIYAKKKLRGLIVEGSAVAIVLLGTWIIGNSLTITFDYNEVGTDKVVNIDELLLHVYAGIFLVLAAAIGTWLDSIYVLYKKIKSEKINSQQ